MFVGASSDLRFLTLKGEEPKYQTLATVQRLCAIIANSYIIVREANKTKDGYHFHALLKVTKEPPKSWFKKGVHMNLKKVGRPQTMEGFVPPVPLPTNREVHEAQRDEVITPEHLEELYFQKAYIKSKREQIKRKNVERILIYMSKELDMPIQYKDYQLVISKKNYKIQDG